MKFSYVFSQYFEIGKFVGKFSVYKNECNESTISYKNIWLRPKLWKTQLISYFLVRIIFLWTHLTIFDFFSSLNKLKNVKFNQYSNKMYHWTIFTNFFITAIVAPRPTLLNQIFQLSCWRKTRYTFLTRLWA